MTVASPPPPAIRPDEVAAGIQRGMDERAEEGGTPRGLRPTITYLPDEKRLNGDLIFRVSVTGEEYGGPVSVNVAVTPERLADPYAAGNAFRSAISMVMRIVERRLLTTRQNTPDGD